MRHRCCDLPLGDLIDGIDVVHPFGIGGIALMHGIDAQKAGPSYGVRFAPLANRHRRRPCLGVVVEALAVALIAAQIVQVAVGNRRRRNCFLPYSPNSRCKMRRVAGPLRVSWASSTSASNSMSARG